MAAVTGEGARDPGLVRMLCLLRNVFWRSLERCLDSLNVSEKTGRQAGAQRKLMLENCLWHLSSVAMFIPPNRLLGVTGTISILKRENGPSVKADTCNPSAWEVETENSKSQASLS